MRERGCSRNINKRRNELRCTIVEREVAMVADCLALMHLIGVANNSRGEGQTYIHHTG